jgi:hypothetical protein
MKQVVNRKIPPFELLKKKLLNISAARLLFGYKNKSQDANSGL